MAADERWTKNTDDKKGSCPMTPSIGIIGLGNAGQALAQALSTRHRLRLFDLDPGQCAQAAEHCVRPPVIADSAADCADGIDLLLLSLPTPKASHTVAQQIAGAIGTGAHVVETSTVQPQDVEGLHAILSPKGAILIDAAVIGLSAACIN
jgi:3-hydroxyisobutyrate dehydrogenase-like beta-hydroxyacid dehydrogenase